MTIEHTDAEQVESILGSIVDEYLDLRAAGSQPDIEAFAEHYPDLADLIRGSLRALDVVGDKLESRGGVAGETPVKMRKQLGDFAILRELGSGGMGFVYEAQQLSMGRHVALKILPMAGALQEKSLQRFRNEVRAASMLDHPNIVSIYSVGEDRGVHYYAMQLIRGQSLARVIEELSRPNDPPRSLTGDSISQVLSAAPATPSSSVEDPTEEDVAKDVEPKVGTSADTKAEPQAHFSTLKTTPGNAEYFRSVARLGIQAAKALQHAHDLGVLHRDIKPANLMLDASTNLHVTDFGLARIEAEAGVTMTGDLVGTLRYMSPEQAMGKRVVVDHRCDIYSLGMTLYELIALRPAFAAADRQELLKQIAFEEPVKLRRLANFVPQELETIVHKAIEKDPQERYATAIELAEDLQAFLDDRAIRAKPPGVIGLTRKWSRRHRALVWTASISALLLLTVAVVLLSISNAMIANERNEKSTALAARNSALSEKERALASADTNLQQALAAVDTMLTRVAEEDLKNVPQMWPVRDALLQDAQTFHLRLLEENAEDPRLRFQVAQSLRKISSMSNSGGRIAKAIAVGRQTIAVMEDLVAKYPSDGDYRAELALAHWNLGNIFCRYPVQDYAKAEPFLRRAISLQRQLHTECPDVVRYREPYADTVIDLAELHWGQARRDEAIEVIDEGAAFTRRLVNDFPDVKGYQAKHARVLFFCAQYRRRKGGALSGDAAAAAEELLREALGLQKSVGTSDPRLQWEIAETLHLLGQLLEEQGRLEEAEVVYRDAIAVSDQLVIDFPSVSNTWKGFNRASLGLGRVLGKQGRLADESVVYRNLWMKLHSCVATVPQHSQKLVHVSKLLIDSLPGDARGEQAGPIMGRTVAALEAAVAKARENERLSATSIGMERVFASEEAGAESEADQAMPATLRARVERALSLAKRELRRYRPVSISNHEADELLSSWGEYVERADYLRALGDTASAIRDYSAAIELVPTAVPAYMERGNLYSLLGRHREAFADYDRAIALKPNDPRVYKLRAATYIELQMYEESVADWEKTMELLEENDRHVSWLPLDEVAAQPASGLHERMILLVDRISDLPVNRTGKACVAIGDFFYRLGRYERAREAMLAAVELAPDDLVVLNNVAWRLATSPADQFRNADLALELATKVCDATEWKDSAYVDTLAAAYAADGNFDEAIRWQRRSIELAFHTPLKERLSLYESHEPFRFVEEETASE